MGAVDAGLWKFNCGEGRFLRRAEAAPRSMTHRGGYPEIGYGEKASLRRWLRKQVEGICGVAIYSDAGRAEARGVLELERVFSCGNSGRRWRTKLDFGSGEPFDDLHGPSAFGTAIKIRSVFGGGRVLFGWRFWG